MSGMFCRCSTLQNLDLSKFKTDKVTDMRSMFFCCSSLEELNIFIIIKGILNKEL